MCLREKTTEQMLEKIRCPERRSTTELPMQLQWDGQSLNTDYQAFARLDLKKLCILR